MRANVLVLMLIASVACAVLTAAEPAQVKIYVPRTVQVQADTLSLGDITVVRSSEPDLAARASAVTMGRAPFPGEAIVLNTRTILSRLAACGIRSNQRMAYVAMFTASFY